MTRGRRAGLLLHPTSLPGPEGVGSLGPHAFAFVDTLQTAGVGLWQVLPLGPTGYGDSPYAGLSAFAGNPLLISLELLHNDGLLSEDETVPPYPLPENNVDYSAVEGWKVAVLRAAFEKWTAAGNSIEPGFLSAQHYWLDDYALFAAVKLHFGNGSWATWPDELRRRDPTALDCIRNELAGEIEFECWLQFQFFRQWTALHHYANERGVLIIGDIPIFVAYDSADVWSHQELFKLDDAGVPLVVAGVPPDYFSATGQLWGNPHYRWDIMASTGFSWWVQRFRTLSQLVDIVRLDHFRGFAAAWEVAYGEPTAERGAWVDGPRQSLFDVLSREAGAIEIIAEDLGVITPDVVALRDQFGYPGMQILQFAFSTDFNDPSLPHRYTHNTVVYTGTHDNDTTVGWWTTASPEERARVRAYVGSSGRDVAWDLIRLAFASVADYAVVPLQDVLRLGTAARMNLPGRASDNWRWRFREGDITESHVEGLRELTTTFGRMPS